MRFEIKTLICNKMYNETRLVSLWMICLTFCIFPSIYLYELSLYLYGPSLLWVSNEFAIWLTYILIKNFLWQISFFSPVSQMSDPPLMTLLWHVQSSNQCDQIGQFFGLWATFKTIILPKSPTFLGNCCKGVKSFHFSSELIFGQLL